MYYYILMLILTFVILMFLSQIIFFEISRNKMKKANNMSWYLSLNKPYSYNRFGYMIFICSVCYLISGPENLFSLDGLVYFVIFLAVGIIADAVVQYLIIVYGKLRCRYEISEATFLQKQLIEISEKMVESHDYEESFPQYDEKEIFNEYFTPESHIAHMAIDEGEFVRKLDKYSEATFVVATYGNVDRTKAVLADKPVQVTKLTPSGQLPFKDEKMDIVMCMNSTYDKDEVKRVLKQNGIYIVSQNGTGNFKEVLQMYVPFGIKGTWDAYACGQTLENIGMRVLKKFEDYGTVRFRSIQAIHTYFKNVSPDLANINKYQMFYMNALKSIMDKSYYEVTTHRFLVIAQKTGF